ncbi:MAG: hypothetical protein IT160_13295 [Bryobacterales bacterium]|nr:hypothetical protein [Bryobacterales bacterium]
MDFDVTPFNLATFLLLAVTVGLIVFRFTRRIDSSWPLVYYFLVVLYSKWFTDSLQPEWVYAAVVTALFLRFELIGVWVIRFFRLVELVILSNFLWRGLGLLMRW